MSVPLLSVCVWEGGGGECGKRGEGSNGRGEEGVGGVGGVCVCVGGGGVSWEGCTHVTYEYSR